MAQHVSSPLNSLLKVLRVLNLLPALVLAVARSESGFVHSGLGRRCNPSLVSSDPAHRRNSLLTPLPILTTCSLVQVLLRLHAGKSRSSLFRTAFKT